MIVEATTSRTPETGGDWQPVIDDGIPLPPAARGPGATKGSTFEPRLPLRAMQPGQSLFVPSFISDYRKLQNRLNRVTANYGIRFAIRKTTENQVTGFRVWRMS